MSIKSNLLAIKQSLPPEVTLVAVSKTKPVEDILQAYQAGQRVFGENKILEMTNKWEALPKDIQWHMIGHVQTNKVKFMAPYVQLVHGVDSLKLLEEINKQAAKHNRIIDCLLQMYIADEQTKFGLDHSELVQIIQHLQSHPDQFQNIRIVGLMGMATFTNDESQIQKEFNQLNSFFQIAKQQPTTPNFQPTILSMGMSGDYKLAVECGSTMVRIGSSIFSS